MWRHPYETLNFLGLRPDSTVVEISPGGGWYTEILAPYLRDKGLLVLTFRNVHNWNLNGDEGVRAVFASAYQSLKHGGVLGVVEHRLPAGMTQDAISSTGYVHQAYVVRMAQSVGFTLEAASEINANPKDTADHVGGVWALPPSYVNKDVDRDKYQAIGESDRMTLKFTKP